MSFPENVRIKCLLWCDRHCCLCKKACGVDIELHHVVPTNPRINNSIDNAIPLCYECHAKIEHYNPKHPRGTKWRQIELAKRREQVYEEFTRHLVPALEYRITQRLANGQPRKLPDVGFILAHVGEALPVIVHVTLDCRQARKSFGPPRNAYYSGKKPWRLNPHTAHHGHFTLPKALQGPTVKGRLEVEVRITVTDCYHRSHPLLPSGFVYERRTQDWYFEP